VFVPRESSVRHLGVNDFASVEDRVTSRKQCLIAMWLTRALIRTVSSEMRHALWAATGDLKLAERLFAGRGWGRQGDLVSDRAAHAGPSLSSKPDRQKHGTRDEEAQEPDCRPAIAHAVKRLDTDLKRVVEEVEKESDARRRSDGRQAA